jgi:hypothetical protein
MFGLKKVSSFDKCVPQVCNEINKVLIILKISLSFIL